jgi:mannose-1-phosphate guanylyltransferase
VVTHEEHAALVKEQLPQLMDDQILAEPTRKNTAACIAYASFKIAQKNSEAIIVVSPSDHLILKENEFLEIIKKNQKLLHFQNFQLVYIESAVAEKKATTDFTKKSKTILEQTNIWTKIHKKSPRQINSEKN